jgi:hypothetical protein
MLRKLKAFLANLFHHQPSSPPPTRSKPYVTKGDHHGNVLIETQVQLDKRTAFLPGEAYRIGESIVTVHASKESMLKAIAAVNAKRESRHQQLRERGIDIMMMKPEELLKLKVEQWLMERSRRHQTLFSKLFSFTKRYVSPAEPPPSGNKAERFQSIMSAANVKEKEPV